MSNPTDPLERLREMNPVSHPVNPDWQQIAERLDERDWAALPTRTRGTSRRTVLGALASLGALAAAAILLLAPSGTSSGLLARAATALAPARGTVLYERWETTITPEAGNPERIRAVTLGPNELWIESDSPRNYRTVLMPRGEPSHRPPGVGLAYVYGVTIGFSGGGFDPRTWSVDTLSMLERATRGRPLELGGTLKGVSAIKQPGEVRPTLAFMPSGTLLRSRLRVSLGASLPGPHDEAIEDGADPVEILRAAIAEGRARVTGTVTIAGRTAKRISIRLPQGLPKDAPPLPAGHPPLSVHPEAQAYVDPTSLQPVEIVFGAQIYRFLAYEYLPATTANVALASIRAQHPRAAVLDTVLRPESGKPR